MSGGARQMDLPLGRDLDLQRALKASASRAMRGCGLSREQIADRINAALENAGATYRVTAAILDRWAAPSDANHSLPAWIVPMFCRATGSREVLDIMAEALGLALAGPRERELMALGEAQITRRRLRKVERQALEALEGLK